MRGIFTTHWDHNWIINKKLAGDIFFMPMCGKKALDFKLPIRLFRIWIERKITIWLATTLRDSLSAQQKVGPFMTSGAVLAAARRTITCCHFGLQFFLQAGRQVESPYALCTVVPKKRAARQAASQRGANVLWLHAASLVVGGGWRRRRSAERRAAHSRPTTGDTAALGRDGVASKVDVFEVVRAVSRR